MPHVVLVNPAERKGSAKAKRPAQRKGKKVMAKKQRTAAQKRATAKMIAANRARRKGKSAPVSRAKPKQRSAPSRQQRSSAKRSTRKRRSHPITSPIEASRAGRKLRYRRKNPIGGFVQDQLVPAALGGGGAILIDVALGAIPWSPEARQKLNPFMPVVKVAAAVGLGMAVNAVTSKRIANQVAAGAITVALYNVMRSGLAKLSGGKIPGLAEYVAGEGMIVDAATGQVVGEYVAGDEGGDQIGYSSAGMMVGELQPDGSVEGYETGVYR